MKTRREFLELASVGGVVFASGLFGCESERPAASPVAAPPRDFFFVQLTDTHWGYEGAANPEAKITLPHAIDVLRASKERPDFVVFTGDLTHTTDDAAERRARMTHFKEIVSALPFPLHFLPGEHDASLDGGAAFREIFGVTHWAFEHGGLHFVALDNVSDPHGALGDAQIAWLEQQVAAVPAGAPLVVFAHRPLFDLYPDWDWATADGARAIDVLARHDPATVFYGHIHQEHHHKTGRIAHHASRSLIFPLPAPGSAPKRAPLPWDSASRDHGLGWRVVHRDSRIDETPYAAPERVVAVEARRFAYSPSEIRARVGEPIVLELTSVDVDHGFAIPALGVRARVSPGKPARVRVVAQRAGTYPFHCDVFCGSGHESMAGELVVEPTRAPSWT